MAGFNFSPIEVTPNPQTSIGDMINTARGFQVYKQAQELNPIQLEQQRELLKQNKITTKKAEATLDAEIAEKIALSQKALIGLNDAKINNLQNHFGNVSRRSIDLLNSETPIDSDRLYNWAEKTLETANASPEVEQQILATIPKGQSDKVNRAWIAKNLTNSLSAEAAFDKLYPSAQVTNLGGTQQFITTGNPQVANQIPGTRVGQPLEITPTPLAYGQRYEPTGRNDKNNNPTAYVKDAQGNILGEVTIPAGVNQNQMQSGGYSAPNIQPSGTSRSNVQPNAVTAPVNQPPANAPLRLPAWESEDTLKQMQDERIVAKDAAAGAKSALRSIDAVMNYLPLAQTGNMSGAISGLQSTLGNVAGSKPEELAASARDIVQKTIVDLAIQKNAALGGKFAASLDSSLQSLADAGKNPTAIAKSMEQLKPLIQHASNYYVGLENSIATHQGNPFVKRAYDKEMAKVFDPLALQMGNAFKAGGKEGLDRFISKNHITPNQEKELFNTLDRYQKVIKGDF